MGWRDLFRAGGGTAARVGSARPVLPAGPPVRAQFSVEPSDFPWLPIEPAYGPWVTRDQLLAIPPMLKARNMIVGSISTMPWCSTRADHTRVRVPLLEQIDPDVANVVTKAQTVEDLLFEAIGWWRVLDRDFAGFPSFCRHVEAIQVSTQIPDDFPLNRLPSDYRPGSHVFIQGEPVASRDMIRFDSPNPPLRVAGARAVRRILKLTIAADTYADNPQMRHYFTPTDGADFDDTEDADGNTEVTRILDTWEAARRVRSTGYVPGSLELKDASVLTPVDLQLQELIKAATLDIANATGLDPEDLGLSTTSRTYANQVDARQDRINECYAAYDLAITQRLSMGDVTRRGIKIFTDWDAMLKPNPVDRMTVETGYLREGVITRDEVRDMESRPPMTPEQEMTVTPPVAPPAPVPTPLPPPREPGLVNAPRVAAAGPLAASFAAEDCLTFDDVNVDGQFQVDERRRTITGLVLPWDAIGKSGGRRWRFQRDSLRYSRATMQRIKLLIDHDQSQAVGRLDDTWADHVGQWARFKVARGEAGDRALALAADGIRDGLSVGVGYDSDDHEFAYGADPADGTINLVTAAPWRETSLVALPAFDGARVSAVTLAADHNGGEMPEQTAPSANGTQATPAAPVSPAPATATFTSEQVAQMLAARPSGGGEWTPERAIEFARQVQSLNTPPASSATAVPQIGQQVTFSANDAARLLQLVSGQRDTETPAAVNPTSRPTPSATRVREAPLYRFDGGKAQRIFTADIAAAAQGDDNAKAVVQRFMDRDMAAMFSHVGTGRPENSPAAVFTNVAPADVAELNPVPTRPELFVPNLSFPRPLGDIVTTGPLSDLIAFIIPKYNTSSGLVATHTTGTEPSSGAFDATSQTVTPKGLSGRVDIDREIIDSGGSPQADQLIYSEMVRAYTEVLETRIVDALQALSLSDTDVVGVDADLQAAVVTLFAGLQFLRGGDRYSGLALHSDLYTALANAVDDNGRPLFPMIGAQNADGTTASDLSSLRVAGKVGVPAWALASGNGGPAKSFLMVPGSVYQWASAPRRFDFNLVNVSSVSIAIWGYSAEAITRTSDVKQLAYAVS